MRRGRGGWMWAGATCALLIFAAKPSSAQNAALDSLVAAQAALQDTTLSVRYRFSPAYANKMDANVSAVSMTNEFRTALNTPWGSIFDFMISHQKKNYRLQALVEETKNMRAGDLHVFNPFWTGTASYSDSRLFNRSIAVGGGFQDFLINDQVLSMGSTYRREIFSFRSDAVGSLGGINSERTFKNDRGLQAGVNGGVAYDVGDRITLQGRGALRGSWDESETVERTFTGLGSSEDSVVTAVRFQAADSIRVDASHSRYSGEREFTDQARGSLGGQTGGAEDVLEERELRNTRNTTLRMDSQIMTRLKLTMTASHDEQVFDYREQKTRYSRTVGDVLNGNLAYTLPWRTITTLQFENTEVLRDYGTESISSLTDKRKRLALIMSHRFSKTFSVDLNGSTQLQQSFYLDYDANPRDRDQLDTNLNVKITSQPFKKVNANISVAYSSIEFINIDASQSSNNRTREIWDLRPGFTYIVTPMLSIIQVYGLSFDYTDYTFEADENFLDRNITFSNEFRFQPARSIRIAFEYALHLHDTGSYLPDPVTGERLLDVSSEDRRDRTRIRVDYDATKNISFFSENVYSRREEWTPGSFDDRDTTTDGQILVGTEAMYDWGTGRRLRFMVSRVKRFSPFGIEAQKDYWDAFSDFAYSF